MCVSTSTQTGDEVQYVEVIYVRRPRGRPRGSNKTPEDKAQAARDNAKQYYEKNIAMTLATFARITTLRIVMRYSNTNANNTSPKKKVHKYFFFC